MPSGLAASASGHFRLDVFHGAPVPAVYGPIAYREWKSQLERIHEVLRLSGLEETFQRLSLAPRKLAEEQAAEKNRPFYNWGTVEQGKSAAIARSCTHVPGSSPL